MKPNLPPQPKHIKAGMDSAVHNKPQQVSIPPNRGGHVTGQGNATRAASTASQQLTPFIERLDAAAVVEGWHNNVLEHIGGVKQENVSGGGLLLATYILQGVSGLLPLQLMRSAEYMESLSQADVENLLESQPGLAQTLSKSIASDSHGDVALKVVEVAFSWLAYEMQEADGCGRFVAYLAMAVLTLLEMPGLQPPNYELLTTGLPPVLRAAKRMAAGRAIYDCTACVTDRKPIEVVLMVIRRLAEVHQPAASLVCASGLTPFLVKLLSEDELTTKQALHLIDLQLREQVSFQDVHELYMLDYITSIPSPHLRTCQLLVGLNTAARLVQILKGTAGSAEPWVTDTAACVLAHIALHKQLHPNLTDAIPAVVAALCKEIDTEEQLCDGDVTCEYVCQPAVEFLAHMASQSANLIDIGLANGIEALARAVAVEPGKQRVTERAILALNLIASGGPSFSNAVARWRNVTNFRNQIDRYVAAQAPLTGPRLDAYITAHQAPLAELEYENICRQAEVDFAADAGSLPSPVSAFVTCATSLTEGGQTSSHADDTRALMTAVLLGGISQDDLTEYMSCFGGLSQVLSHIGHVMRLHCGTIVCGPSVSSQEAEEDQSALSSTASIQELGDDAPVTAVKGAAEDSQSSQHLQVNGGVPALKKRTGATGNNSLVRSSNRPGSKPTSQVQNGVLIQPDADALNMLPTEEELLTCDCPFCVAYRGRSGSVRGAPTGPPSCAAKAPVTTAMAGAKLAPPLLTTPLKDPFAQGFKATAVIGISCKATPVYRTNDPFTFKINDFKLPTELVDDIVNKRYPACLAVLITESLELEGLWVPSASPNIKDKDGSDVLQFQRFRVFHPLPKQAHHGILKTLWDKRVQWNQGLNARRTKQLLQAFLDQDVRLGIPSQALPLPATAPRPAVTATPASTSVVVSASTPVPALPAASTAVTAPAAAVAKPAPTAAAAKPATAAAAASPIRAAAVAAEVAPASAVPSVQLQATAQDDVAAVVANQVNAAAQNPAASPSRTSMIDSAAAPVVSSPLSTPVSKPMHQRKGRDQRAAAARKLALDPGAAPAAGTPSHVSPQPDFTPLTPTSTAAQSDAMHAVPGFDNAPLEAFEMQPSELGHMAGDDLPNLPPLHLSKAQHRSVRTDDGEEVHVLVSPVRSQGGDDSPSSPSRLPDSVLKAMCNMGKAFLSRFTSGPKSSARNPSDDDSLDSPSSASGGQPTSPLWAPLDQGLSRSSAPNPLTSVHTHVPSARRSSSMRADSRTSSPSRSDSFEAEPSGAVLQPAPELVPKDTLRPAQNGFKPNQRTGSLRPATRTAVKALPVGIHRNPRRPSSQDTARVQAVARNAAAQSVPPGVVDLIAAAQREIDAASASAEQLIRENDFAEDGLDLDFDAFLESDGIAELVAQAQATAGSLPAVQHTPSRHNAHARRARSPATSLTVTPVKKAAVVDSGAVSSTPLSPSRAETTAALPVEDAAGVTGVKTTAAQPAVALPAAAGAAFPEAVSTATAAASTPVPSTASTTVGVKELPKGNAKQKRAHKNADAIRARLKQRLEAAQEGVSTEDGSSSVTSGLDEDQAAQADMMMRRLVQEEEERLRREGERASKRLQKSADSAQASAVDAESEEGAFSNQPAEQQPAAPTATILSASAAEAASAGDTEGGSAEGGQQARQQQAQARPQASAAPTAKLTKAQRQRQKRLAKQALAVEQSSSSATGSLSDARYSSPDDATWETVVKKGSKGNKAASKASTAAAAAASVTASAVGLQAQANGMSQISRAGSGVLPLLITQDSGVTPTPVGTPSAHSRSAEGSHLDDSHFEESGTAETGGKVSADEIARMGSFGVADQEAAHQNVSTAPAEASVLPAAAQEAASRAGLQAPAPLLRPSNWAGLLKSRQPQRQQPSVASQDWQLEEESPAHSVTPIVSNDAFPQLGAAFNSGLDHPMPSQLSVSELSLSLDRSQGQSVGLSQSSSEVEMPSVASSPFASADIAAQDALASQQIQTPADSAASRQDSQSHITQQLHANAAIWGNGLTSGISGLQLPQQPQQLLQQQPSGLYHAPASAAAPPANNPWDPQPTPQPSISASLPQAPARPTPVSIKSLLPANAQPFVPQIRLSNPAAQGQQPAFPGQAHQQHTRQQQHHQQATAVSQQQAMPGNHAFMQQSTSFGRPQQPPSISSGPYPHRPGFESMLRPAQTHGLGVPSGSLLDPGRNRGVDVNSNVNVSAAALQQLQRQQHLELQRQHQGGVAARQQPQQQLADIWSQPSLSMHQNGGSSTQPAGPFAAHQPPSVPKGKSSSNGPFSAHQAAASAFQQHQVPISQQQYSGQQQGRYGNRSDNGSYHAAPSMNGMANGHLSSTGTQSEEDELLSGVFTKVWEDNLQESQDFLGRQSPEASVSHSVSHAHVVPPKDIAAAWNLTPADMHKHVDAAAAFNNNSSYSTAFLNSNGHSGKLPGNRGGAFGQPGQLPHGVSTPQSSQMPQVPLGGGQIPQSVYGALHAPPFRPGAQRLSQQLPAGVVCPLTKQVMKDPVTAADGLTYERGAIVHWMHANGLSPVTHQPLHNKHLTPNAQVKQALNRMKQSERAR